jgi:hypothetical protein
MQPDCLAYNSLKTARHPMVFRKHLMEIWTDRVRSAPQLGCVNCNRLPGMQHLETYLKCRGFRKNAKWMLTEQMNSASLLDRQ